MCNLGLQVLDGDDASSSSGDSDFGDKVKAYLQLLAIYLIVVVAVVNVFVFIFFFRGVCIPAYMLYAITSRMVGWFAASLLRLVAG